MSGRDFQDFCREASKVWKCLAQMTPLQLLALVVESDAKVESISFEQVKGAMSSLTVADDTGEYEIPIVCVTFTGIALDLTENCDIIVINGKDINVKDVDHLTIKLQFDRAGKLHGSVADEFRKRSPIP